MNVYLVFSLPRLSYIKDTYKLPHRLIEKKRRDRINECIAQLKDLLPEHLKLTVRCTFSFFAALQGRINSLVLLPEI